MEEEMLFNEVAKVQETVVEWDQAMVTELLLATETDEED